MRAVRLVALVAAVSIAIPVGAVTVAHAEPVDAEFSGDSVILVVDVSGSMNGLPLAQAKEALTTSVSSIADDVAIGLRSYAGGCGDGGDLLVDVGLDNRAELQDAINTLSAGGGTPTPDALRAAIGDLPTGGNRTVVLISDGQSSCGSACNVIDEFGGAGGVDFTVFTVGFNAPTSAAADLTCVAEATGGSYFEATDAASLVDAIGGAVSGQRLVIRALPNQSVLNGEVDTDVEIRVLVKVELPNGDDAVAAVVSVDGEISGVTGADGLTTVPVLVDEFWDAVHPDGVVEISATLGSRAGAIEADLVDLSQQPASCAYDGFPTGGNSIGTYLSFLMPGAPGRIGELLEAANNTLDVFSTGLEAFDTLKPKDVRTSVTTYRGSQGVYETFYVLRVKVSAKTSPISASWWIVSKDAALIDIGPKDLFSKLARNCFVRTGPVA